MTCKDVCIRIRAQKPKGIGTGRYLIGQKRCQVCQVFINWPNLWCPCCGYRLRTRPRNVKLKSKLLSTSSTPELFPVYSHLSAD